MALADELRERIGDRLQIFLDEEGARVDLDAEIARLAPGGELYVCGPIGMLEAAKRALAAERPPRGPAAVRDLRQQRPLRHPRPSTSGSLGSGWRSRFRRIRPCWTRWRLPVSTMIFDCRRGECGLCALDILEVDGIVDHRDVFFSDEEKAENRKLCTCVSRVAGGSITVDTADRAA